MTMLPSALVNDHYDVIKTRVSQCKVIPWDTVQFAVEALRDGANMKDAAKAAGISPHTMKAMVELGEEGHPVWAELTAVLLQADYSGMRGTIVTRKNLSEKGNPQMMKRFEQYKDPEQFGTIYGEERGVVPDGSVAQMPGGITVQIAQFPPPEKKEALPVVEITPELSPGEKELD